MEQEKLLIEAFLLEKSENAFSQLYQLKTPALYQMALRLTQQKSDADELVQKTWVIAIQKLNNFKYNSSLKTWLTGILINLFREHNRQKIYKNTLLDTLDINKKQPHQALLETIDLENAIQLLPAGYREVFVLHDIEGYTHKEIGAMLHVSDGTSKSQLFHARKAIRKYLYDNDKNQ